jgi:Fic family protein
LLDYPVLFISGYIQAQKDKYYKSLSETHQTDDYTNIIMYILDAIHRQSEKTSDKIIRIGSLIKDLEEGIATCIKKKSHAMAWTLLSNPFITIQNIADSLGVTRQTAALYCKKLNTAGIVQMSNVGKYTLVSVPGFINLLAE